VTGSDVPAIRMRGLTKVYEPSPAWMSLLTRSASRTRNVALRDVDLDVPSGTICAVVGPNGAGKSTMFRLLMGLTTPTSGSAHVLGLDCSIRSESRRMPIGFMPADERSLFLRLTSHENLAFQASLRGYGGRRLERRVAEVLEMVGLAQARDTAAFALSSGMKARLQLARAMVHEPRVLILDEPTSTVDPVAADDLLALIQRLTSEHSLAVMLSSHRLEEIDALDEKVVLLDDGRVVFEGDLRELRRIAALTEVALELDTDDAATGVAATLEGAPWVRELTVHGRLVELVATVPIGAVLAAIGPRAASIVHLDERSSSTRSLLREVYASSRGDAA
jgi:ABC-2 type transport system ATP-binding protein